MLDELLDHLDRIELSAPVFRTAVRMARLADAARSVVLTYEQARALAGTESDATVRAHLHQLHAAGVLWFRRNEVIRVGFYAQPVLAERAERAPSQQNASPANTDTEDERALSARNAEPANTDDVDGDEGRALSARNAEPANTARAERAKRAPSQQYKVGRVGRQVGDQPTYLPGGSGGGGGLTPEESRTVALLTDPAFGMDSPTAVAIARQFSFEVVRAHAFAVLDDVQAGKVRSVYVLAARLKRGGQPQITAADRLSGLWKRHCPEEVVGVDGTTAEELRRRFMPDELAGVVIG
jgi:hypothetical protein